MATAHLDPQSSTPPPRWILPVQEGDLSVHEIPYRSKPLLRELIETILVTLLIFLAVQTAVQNRRVDGQSMDPTLHDTEYLLIDKASYLRWDNTPLAGLVNKAPDHPLYVLGAGPQRGDIVVFHPPVDTRDYIKRIIGLPSETVQIKTFDGVYIDGVRLSEPYIKDTPDYNYGPLTVPAGDVFVLGDNRRNSSDSHAWGPLQISEIVGKAWLSYWPREWAGLLPHPTYAAVGGSP